MFVKIPSYKYNLIDPLNMTSIGLNPFIYDDASKNQLTISSVLKGMYVNSHSRKRRSI